MTLLEAALKALMSENARKSALEQDDAAGPPPPHQPLTDAMFEGMDEMAGLL